jgi:uncharacterized protein
VKLDLSCAGARNTFTGYGAGYVLVNGARHESSVIVLPERVIAWRAADFASLREEDFAELVSLAPQIVLLGTGPSQRFPHPSLLRSIAAARIGIEVMDLHAACRTYNILAAESRAVAAALLFA